MREKLGADFELIAGSYARCAKAALETRMDAATGYGLGGASCFFGAGDDKRRGVRDKEK